MGEEFVELSDLRASAVFNLSIQPYQYGELLGRKEAYQGITLLGRGYFYATRLSSNQVQVYLRNDGLNGSGTYRMRISNLRVSWMPQDSGVVAPPGTLAELNAGSETATRSWPPNILAAGMDARDNGRGLVFKYSIPTDGCLLYTSPSPRD